MNRDWWKHPLPDTVAHEKNFVLTEQETEEAIRLLVAMRDLAAEEAKMLSASLSAMRMKRVATFAPFVPPIPTWARVLNVMVTSAKHHKSLLDLSLSIVKARRQHET